MTAAVPRPRLRDVADLNPPLQEIPATDELVSFLPMAGVHAETVDAVDTETRRFQEVSKGYTPFLADDVLVAKITPCFENGKIAQAKPTRRFGFGSTEFHVVRAHAKALDPRFLVHFLRQEHLRKEGERKMTGSAGQRRVPEHFLADLRIPLHPLPEQRRIAEILDKADALRAKRRAALAQLDALTQSIFLEMFGDPGTNPKGWPNVSMGALFAASPIFGTMIPPTETGGTWLSLRVANIQDWELDLTDQKFVELPSAMVDRHGVQDGDVLLARAIASQEHLGKAIVVYPQGRKWAFDSHLMRLRFDRDKAEPEFIQHLLKSDGGRRLFLRAARRSAVQFNINTKEITALRIPVPSISLQRAFVRCIDSVRELKNAQAVSLTELNAFFAAAQYCAFRGEL